MLALLVALLALVAGGCGKSSSVVRATGGCEAERSPYLAKSEEVAGARISYCDHGDDDEMIIESRRYPAGTDNVKVMLAGWPNSSKVRLEAVAESGRVSAIDTTPAGDRWQARQLIIPEAVKQTAFRIRLVDEGKGQRGWAGLGDIRRVPRAMIAAGFGRLLAFALICQLWLFCAGFMLPTSFDVRSRVLASSVVLGVASFATFVAHVPSPTLGAVFALVALIAPALAAAERFRRDVSARAMAKPLLSQLWPPFALTLLILWLGIYPFSWNGEDWTVPGHRWADLPVDSWLPYHFAKMLQRGVIDHPMTGDWLSSDRPPLQTGLFLMFSAISPARDGFLYQACSTWAQTLLILPLGLLLPSSLGRWARASVLLIVGLLPTLAINSLFVWPKLFAAGYCALYHLALFEDDERSLGGQRNVLAGLAAGLVLLSHGGAIFALIGSTLALLLYKRLQAVPRIAIAAGASIALLLPWIAYQRVLDPPGDRLLKMHFAGQVDIVPLSFGAVLARAYSGLTLSSWFDGRIANVENIFHASTRFFSDVLGVLRADTPAALAQATDNILQTSFFYTGHAAWFFGPVSLLAVIAVAILRRRRIILPAGLVLATGLALLSWSILMFVPRATVIHQGALFSVVAVPLLVSLICVQSSRWLFAILTTVQVSLFMTVFAFDRPLAMTRPAYLYISGVVVLTLSYLGACLSAATRSGSDAATPEPKR